MDADMDIKILHLLEGADQAKGLAVVIDVFRAFSLECYLLRRNGVGNETGTPGIPYGRRAGRCHSSGF